MLPKVLNHYQTRNSEDLAIYQTRTNIFKFFKFFSIQLWNGTLFEIQLIYCFKITTVSNPVNNIQNLFSNIFKTNHNFQNSINPLRTYSLEVESAAHLCYCHIDHALLESSP